MMFEFIKSSKLMSSIILVAVAMSFAACGKKGDLESPQKAVASEQSANQGDDMAETPAKPDKPFVLDGMLQ